MPGKISYGKALFIAFDQLVNTFFMGWPDETISSRSWRWHVSGRRSWPRKLIEWLFFWEKNHCQESFESERLGRQLPPEARMIEKTAASYAEFLEETLAMLKERLDSGKISQEDYDNALKHLQELRERSDFAKSV